MKQRSVVLLFEFVFWTILFVVARGIFLLYFAEARTGLTLAEIVPILKHGFLMDLSMSAYLTLFTGLLLALFYFKTGIQLWPIWIAVHTIALIGASFIIVCDLALYPVWLYRLDARALSAIDIQLIAGDSRIVIMLIAIFFAFAGTWIFLSIRIFRPRFQSLRATSLATLPVILGFTALMIVPMRSSLGVVSMNNSFAYSHPTNAFANHAGVNVSWCFANSLWWPTTGNGDSPDGRGAASISDVVVARPDTTARLIKHEKPNIIIILLDRLPADMVGALGGRADATPNLNKLAGEGILFDQFYSNSDRFDEGLAAVLNGYPSQAQMSTMSDARRAQGLPYLNKVFKSQGYSTGFTHGGWSNYNNLRAYLFGAAFDSVTHADDFVAERRSGKWGVPDELVFQKFSDEVFHERQPFFRVMKTYGTRQPYDAPMEVVVKGRDEQAQFLNAVHYSDKLLGSFIENAKKTLWWDNTVVIITADHGNAMPGAANEITPAQFRIPMLWLGGAIAKQDTVIHTLGNQTDICHTLLAQVGLSSKDFAFSKNIISGAGDQSAMFVFDGGFGIVKPYGAGIFDHTGTNAIYSERVNGREAEQGLAYFKAVRSDYGSR
jgi:phosphoglycerol transferase MdoB-like AlkP superfamily enzyme